MKKISPSITTFISILLFVSFVFAFTVCKEPEPPHVCSYGNWTTTVSPTCTNEGQQTRNCTGCSNTESRTIAALGHYWGNWIVTTAATETTDGVETSTCANCSEAQTRPIPATGIIGTGTFGITLSETGTYTFSGATQGYGAQAARTVTITNTGNQATGLLTVELSGPNAGSFTLTATSVSSIAAGGSNSNAFNVKPNTGLAAGTYTATVTVSGGNGITASFGVSFTVINPNAINPTVTWPSGLTAIYGQTLSEIPITGGSSNIAGTFSWTNPSHLVGSVGVQSHNMIFTPTDIINYNTVTEYVSITVVKAPGELVSAPTLYTITLASITINQVTTSTGQAVEYSIDSGSTWQSGTTFSSLSAGTTYYIIARSVGNTNYETGQASSSLTVTTLQTVPDDRIILCWIDEHDDLVSTNSNIIISAGDTITFTAQDTGYINRQWYVNGSNTGQTGTTYIFSSTTPGNHIVGLFVEKDGKLYNTNITITVQ